VSDVLDQRCREVIAALPIPRPFDLERFRLALSRQRERTLRFVPAPRTTQGLWIAAGDEDHIFYPRDATPLRQLHVIAREIGHMVLEHDDAPSASSEIARLLLPSLDPELVVTTLGRPRYTEADRKEADLFAVLLLDHMEVEVHAP
jgi:hypothetical protein